MASELLNIPATIDKDLILSCDDSYFSIQVIYSNFASASSVDAEFKMLISNTSAPDSFVELSDNNVVVGDADGNIIFRNEKPVNCTYLMLRYAKNSVNDGEYNVYVAPQTEIIQ